MSVETNFAFELHGCFNDNPQNSLFSTLLAPPQNTLYECLKVCDSINSLSLCAFGSFDTLTNSPQCRMADFTSNWDRLGNVSKSNCDQKCSDTNIINVPNGCGKSSTTNPLYSVFTKGNGPSNKAPIPATEKLSQLKVELKGCYSASSDLVTLSKDMTPQDCLAYCNFTNFKFCGIAYGGRICYGSNEVGKKEMKLEECNAVCHYPSVINQNIRCGGLSRDGVRLSVYELGSGSLLKDLSSPTSLETNVPIVTNNIQIEKDIPKSNFSTILITVLVIIALFFLAIGMFLVYRIEKKKKMEKQNRISQLIYPTEFMEGKLPIPIKTVNKVEEEKSNIKLNSMFMFKEAGISTERRKPHAEKREGAGVSLFDSTAPLVVTKNHIAPWE
ncbi:hypothetical protein HK099_007611 [Clydaea vesicula]|uniref:WSC domain-containing protein n=1 Tax=Clydaea vesicula TaxID=447962 RepID=A0AAD5XTJ6_9FUNG|nr:hypothetical protein HK099_007611 [Clydaea vesicula]